jgi:hypothetical protein
MTAIVLFVLAVWIGPNDDVGCGEEDPPAIAGDWGVPMNGLSVRALTDSKQLDLGALVRMGVGFRFDSMGVPSPPSALDVSGHFGPHGGLAVRFVPIGESNDGAIGYDQTYMRGSAAPPRPSADLVATSEFDPYCLELLDIDREVVTENIRLMSDEEEHVPPGRYSVTIRYENDGGPLVTGWPHRTPPSLERCWAPPESIWIGVVETAPIEVEIVDKPPAAIPVRLPTKLELSCVDGRWLRASEDSASASVETVLVRPGYILHCESWDAIYVEDATPLEGLAPPAADPQALAETHPYARRIGGSISRGRDLWLGQYFSSMSFEQHADLLARGTRYLFRRKLVVSEVIRGGGGRPAKTTRILAEHILDAPWTMESLCR